ncbi:hypothetical protein D3C71_625160 [compost metagenome]
MLPRPDKPESSKTYFEHLKKRPMVRIQNTPRLFLPEHAKCSFLRNDRTRKFLFHIDSSFNLKSLTGRFQKACQRLDQISSWSRNALRTNGISSFEEIINEIQSEAELPAE